MFRLSDEVSVVTAGFVAVAALPDMLDVIVFVLGFSDMSVSYTASVAFPDVGDAEAVASIL